MKTAILLQTNGGYWAKGKTFVEAINNLKEISALRMRTKISITYFFCKGESKDWYETISCDMLNITYNEGDQYFQDGETFAFGDFFNLFGVCAEALNRMNETEDPSLNRLAMDVERGMEKYGQDLPENKYDDLCFYQ